METPVRLGQTLTQAKIEHVLAPLPNPRISSVMTRVEAAKGVADGACWILQTPRLKLVAVYSNSRQEVD